MASVSYANVAAHGSPEASPKAAEPPTPVADAAVAPKSPEPPKKLAPAPVPATNAWGAAAAQPDGHSWPQAREDPKAQPKFIKPITNKWVPINAKLMLPNDRQQKKAAKKNKKKNKKKDLKEKDKDDAKDPEKDSDDSANAPKSAPVSPEKLKSPPQPSPDAAAAVPSYKKYPIPVQNPGFYPSQVPMQMPPNYQYGRQFRPNQYRNVKGFNSVYPNGYAAYPNGYVNGYAANGFMPQMPIPQYQIPIPQPQQIPPPISPKQDPSNALVQQIDYYFSLENLIKDIFLRKNMTPEGWINLSLILNFKRVKIILNNIQNSLENPDSLNAVILDSIKQCSNIETNYKNGDNSTIEDVELRVRENYQQWILESQ